ncbi:gene transfer agent family protein [Coralliovum pocilloporae]|uniref:gene transfer agent family protein n=1 Tax=Coralliovum pocilloporae TaxID=3066369 RepID=UPI003306B262
MANSRRGEVDAVIDGERKRLCLTLGALAELETAFGVGDLSALAERFEGGRLSALDCTRILAAGLRGAGHPVTDDDVAAMAFEGGVAGCARLVSELLVATFGEGEEPSGATPGEPDPARPSPGMT